MSYVTEKSVEDVKNVVEDVFRSILQLSHEALRQTHPTLLPVLFQLLFRHANRRRPDQFPITMRIASEHFEFVQRRAAIRAGKFMPLLAPQNERGARSTVAAGDDFRRMRHWSLT